MVSTSLSNEELWRRPGAFVRASGIPADGGYYAGRPESVVVRFTHAAEFPLY